MTTDMEVQKLSRLIVEIMATERIRIYHYYGNETGNISFKIKIEEQ